MNYQTTVKNVNEVLGQYEGLLTLRQIYYRLVANYGLANRRSSYNQLSKCLVKAREDGEVDDTRIADRSRNTEGGDFGFASPKEYLTYKADAFSSNNYTRKIWDDQPSYVEVWVEKDALSLVLGPALSGLRVVLAPSKGYSSYTFIKRMAVDERFSQVDKPIIILDFRDHDPSGIQMTEDLLRRFIKYQDPSMEITVKRIALTIDQVREYKLEPNPVKLADPRSSVYRASYGETCWELDAIPPNELTRIVQEAVQREIDSEAWEKTRKASEIEKKKLQPKLDRMAAALKKMVEGELSD